MMITANYATKHERMCTVPTRFNILKMREGVYIPLGSSSKRSPRIAFISNICGAC